MSEPLPTPAEVPPAADPARLDRVRTLVSGLLGTMRLSATFVHNRRPIDLGGLEGAVGLLCAKALDLDPADGRVLLPDLVRLLEEITLLARALAAQAPAGADLPS